MGEWQGVSIADNRAVEVDTFNLGLAGSIPSELGSLANLQRLNLSFNELTGEMPMELGNLSKLEELLLPGKPVGWGDTGGVGKSLQPERPNAR